MKVLALCAAFVILAVGCGGETTDGDIEAARLIASQWIAAARDLDADAVVDLFSDEDISFRDPSVAAPITHKGQVLELYRQLFSLPGVEVAPGEPIIDSDGTRIAIPWVWSGLDPLADQFYSISGVSIFDVDDGRITGETAIYDPAGSPFAPQQVTLTD